MRTHPRTQRLRFFVLALVCLATTAAGGAGRAAPLDEDPRCGWAVEPSPTVSGGLSAVASLPTGEAWAVGFAHTIDGKSAIHATLTEHFDGSSWRVIPSPSPHPFESRLDGIAALSAREAWAVGSTLESTLIEHWDGSGWTVVASPNPPNSFNRMMDVAAVSPNDIWAVGFSQPADVFPPTTVNTLVEHWDGTRWSIVESPNPIRGYNVLLGVSASSKNDVWAVGWSLDPAGTGRHPTALHWDGRSWDVVETPETDGSLDEVIAVSRNQAWAVGSTASSGGDGERPLALRWDGRAWAVVDTPDVSGLFTSLARTSWGDLWAVGYYTEWTTGPLAARWDGRRWALIETDGLPGGIFTDGSVAASGRTAWFVGSVADETGIRTLIGAPAGRCRS